MKNDDWVLILTLHRLSNLTKAARQLHMSQPALTKRLRQIETEYGVVIVNRNSKGISFTPEGEYLASQAVKFLELLHVTKQNLQQMRQDNVGTVKIGSGISIARTLLPKIFHGFKTKFPKIELRMQVALSSEVPRLVHSQEIHVGFMNGEQPHDDVQSLFSIGQGILVSKAPISIQDLPKRNMIRCYRDPYSRKLITEWWKNNFKKPCQVGMDVIDLDTCREMLLKNLGYGVIFSNYMQESDHSFYKIPMFYSNKEPLIRNTWMRYRKNSLESPIIRHFVDYVIQSSHPIMPE